MCIWNDLYMYHIWVDSAGLLKKKNWRSFNAHLRWLFKYYSFQQKGSLTKVFQNQNFWGKFFTPPKRRAGQKYPSFGVLYSLDHPPLMPLTPLSCVVQMLLDKHIVRDTLDIQHDRRVIPITPLGWIIDWLKANTVLVHFVLGAWSQSWEPVDVEEGSWSLQWASESPNTLGSELILCLYTRRVYLYITVKIYCQM